MRYRFLFVLLFISFFLFVTSALVVNFISSWDTAGSGNSAPEGITMNNTYFWVTDIIDAEVYKYYHNGTYTNDHYDTAGSGCSFPGGITMNNTYFWITDYNDAEVYQYHINGTYTGTSWDTAGSGNTIPRGITTDGTYFWVTFPNGDKVYQYYMNGTYTGTSWDTAGSYPNCITTDGTYFWITDSVDDEVYQYYMNGTYTGTSWDTAGSGNGVPYGITMNDTYFWVTDPIDDEVYQYYYNTPSVTSSLMTESQTNPTQIYTNTSTPYFNWTYSDINGNTQYSWEIQVGTASGLSDMWDSGQLLGTDLNDVYTGSTLSRNTTYYVQIRTNDSYENSTWETGTFKINALPVVSNVVITPSPAVDTDDLTAGNDTATDGNGDSISLYYRWYKDDVLQIVLNDIIIINSSNLTTGDVWKVGIIPNDGYENGTETFSATSTIGSTNVAPTLTGISSNLTTRKYNKSVTISTIDAYDQNDDNYTLHIGTTTGLSDLCNSSSTANGTEATCNFLIPWTLGNHIIYGRLTDANDTSIEYQEVITVDTTPPVIGTTTATSTNGLTSTPISITANVTVANGSIDWVYACVSKLGDSCVNGTMTYSAGDIYTYSYIGTTSAGNYYISFYASDNSGNVKFESNKNTITLNPSEGQGGGGGVTVNITELGDLTLIPPRLDTYYILTGDEQEATYRFIANRVVESCTSELGRCEISEGYIIKVYYTINTSMNAIEDKITITDKDGYTATADVILRIINANVFIPFGIEIPVGEGLGSFLSVFFEVADGVVIGIKTWFLGALFLGLGYFGIKSDLF